MGQWHDIVRVPVVASIECVYMYFNKITVNMLLMSILHYTVVFRSHQNRHLFPSPRAVTNPGRSGRR